MEKNSSKYIFMTGKEISEVTFNGVKTYGGKKIKKTTRRLEFSSF